MAKRTSAKAFFEAQGRSAASQGLPILINRGRRATWPMWAREAWARGWILQRPEVEHFLEGVNHG